MNLYGQHPDKESGKGSQCKLPVDNSKQRRQLWSCAVLREAWSC